MALATIDDVEARLGRDLTPEEADRVSALVEDVSAAVQLHTGQQFTRAERTYRVRPSRSYVRLPQRPVHSVTDVTTVDGDPVSHRFDGLDRVYLHARPDVVDVTYDAGPESVPDAIVGVVSGVVLRALGVDPTETAMAQESIDGYAFTLGSAGGSGAFGVLPDEAKVLRAFSRPLGTIRTGP